MANTFIHGGGYSLEKSRYCPHCHRWFALVTLEENLEARAITCRCEHCCQCVVIDREKLASQPPHSLRNLY